MAAVSALHGQLENAQHIQARAILAEHIQEGERLQESWAAVAAVLVDGLVATWGDLEHAGVSSAVQGAVQD